ncbi:deoxyribose-phosphate aldolase [Mycoplasma testudineum]|uniref:Deoxyribose-phosphate aldolase n=1 Tax=Mycoplasma testudineum TaxID=244584 RepID=A0A4R6IFS5_9MOLU|nr:deoxyribose-phosphate aldolase [Mycoplasma testudineum]OYD27000.1 deoxyribose-phosphate aldolase [Mycoplasma testudineum]TDO20548.1 deoxyribose-phosphate aldolase [Mycoplasma testudineum]
MEYNKLIDHTYLKPEARQKDIDKLIEEAIEWKFKTICVNSSWVAYAASKLKNSEVGITSVIGFPLGAMITQAKAQEAKLAIDHGASEIDMVINIGKLKDKEFEYVLNDIKSVKKAIGNHVLKVIIETALLTQHEIIEATEIVLKSGAEFVKTSTGFSFRGATLDDVKTMKKVVGNKIQIKAAGGVKTHEDLVQMVEAGASRIGTSSGVKLMKKEETNKNDY